MVERILEGALNVFKKKGPKFTMDDIASEMKMSKKTIYTVFNDKNELMCAMVDYTFDLIKEAEDRVYNDNTLSTVDKLRSILVVLPEKYYAYGFSAMQVLAAKYAKAYQMLKERLESGWDKTFDLLKKGMEEGSVREISLPVFKLMYESSIERILVGDFLKENNMRYPEALENMASVLIDGILV